MDISPATPLGELLAEARRVRERHHGNRVTYSPKVFIPLTMLCRDHCGYCTFAKPPARLGTSAFLAPEQVLEIARAGAAAGCSEALFTLGERPEERYPVARQALADLGHDSTVDYLVESCRLVLTETGLLPHANAGALIPDELAALRRVAASQGMMLESLSERLGEPGGPHARCQTKLPGRRLATLEAAGELAIPFTTGILVGIGETRAERLEALAAIGAAHRRHGHVQEVIVQNFRPKPGTAMAAAAPPAQDDYLWTIAAARVLLDPGIHLQAPPNLTEDFGVLLEAGIDDWGGVSPVTADHVNPEAPWPALERLRQVTEAAGMTLAPRLTIYPELAADPGRWLDPDLRFPVLDRSDSERLARDDRWAAGDHEPPPILVDPARFPGRRVGGRVGEVLAGVAAGQQPGEEELVALFAARGPEVRAVAEVADDLRRQAVGDVVTFVRNRNINYTNVCTFRCRFCAFSKGPASLNLRGAPYLLAWTRWPGGWSRPTSAGPPRSPCRAASIPASTATTTCTWPRPCTRPCPACTSTASPPSRSTRAPAAWASRSATTCCGSRRPGWPACPAPPPRSSTTRSGPSSARTRSPPRSGWRSTGWPTRWGCAPTSPSCSATSSRPGTGPGTCCGPGPCRLPRAGSPSSCPCRSCTWPPPCTASASPGPGRPSARPC